MEKIQNALLIVLILALLLLAGFFALGYTKNHSNGFLDVRSSEAATIYIDGQPSGSTPQRIKANKDQVLVSVVPVDRSIQPFEAKVEVAPKTTSSLNVKFSASNETSYLLTYFEKVGGNIVETSVISVPNLARVKLDGQNRGFSPLKLTTTLGKHSIEVSFDGYSQQAFEIETKEGYRSVVVVGLAKDTSFVAPTPTPIATTEPEATIQVEILDTPTGFLRVRADSSSQGEELGQAHPGEKYKFIEKNEANDWYKIEFKGGEGWVSSQYAKLIE